ncbi:hypothetical protein B0A52_10267 [Exophiala mesophila]|uniref:Uncharacterized protein n=1 Tax=Exophiala mesophila TaxID=212818 RepID=A0A438MQG3_EXOME|nr:hypothetical protein B0A52_10267 [Exophiala mesophila]
MTGPWATTAFRPVSDNGTVALGGYAQGLWSVPTSIIRQQPFSVSTRQVGRRKVLQLDIAVDGSRVLSCGKNPPADALIGGPFVLLLPQRNFLGSSPTFCLHSPVPLLLAPPLIGEFRSSSLDHLPFQPHGGSPPMQCGKK